MSVEAKRSQFLENKQAALPPIKPAVMASSEIDLKTMRPDVARAMEKNGQSINVAQRSAGVFHKAEAAAAMCETSGPSVGGGGIGELMGGVGKVASDFKQQIGQSHAARFAQQPPQMVAKPMPQPEWQPQMNA